MRGVCVETEFKLLFDQTVYSIIPYENMVEMYFAHFIYLKIAHPMLNYLIVKLSRNISETICVKARSHRVIFQTREECAVKKRGIFTNDGHE